VGHIKVEEVKKGHVKGGEVGLVYAKGEEVGSGTFRKRVGELQI
jgi:hypothetical protein